MIWIVIIFFVVAAISLAAEICDETIDRIISFSRGGIFLFSIMIAVTAFVELLSPSIAPMDVYQGKTTLEYTVIDCVKVDSCVIWKK